MSDSPMKHTHATGANRRSRRVPDAVCKAMASAAPGRVADRLVQGLLLWSEPACRGEWVCRSPDLPATLLPFPVRKGVARNAVFWKSSSLRKYLITVAFRTDAS